MMEINELARRACENAVKRGKTSTKTSHDDDFCSICAEMNEFYMASEERPSEHLPLYTEAVEELGDVMIACMTELCKRNVDVEKLISDKIRFNELRT